MKSLPNLTLLSFILTAALLQGTSGQTTYAMDPEASHVTIRVGKTGLFSLAGHSHEVAAPVAEGTISVQLDDLPRSSVRVAFDAATLKVSGRGEPAADVPEVQQRMEGPQVLDASRFPRVTFASRSIEVLGRDGAQVRLRVVGDLTLHGVTRPETAEVTASITPTHVTAKGTLRVKQTDFGIQPVTAGLGTVRVKDEVEAEFTLAGRLVTALD